ncbi:MAG: hypothetical protein ABIP39_09235 [Polyangiaceae bacterium]
MSSLPFRLLFPSLALLAACSAAPAGSDDTAVDPLTGTTSAERGIHFQ